MKKAIIDKGIEINIYPPLVKLIDFEGQVYVGYLIKSLFNDKGYAILPYAENGNIATFKATYIKEISYVENGYKWDKKLLNTKIRVWK